MTFSKLDWLYVVVVALGAIGASFLIRGFRRRDPEEVERRRRERVGRIGRVAQCEILDILEGEPVASAATGMARAASLIPLTPATRSPLVVYRYMVSGVSYETTQDVAEPSDGNRLPLPGQIASVKYDPANPSNSILVNWSWSGSNKGPSKPAMPEEGR